MKRIFVKSCRDADNLPLTIDVDDEPGCPRCNLGNFPNMPGELCDECTVGLLDKLAKGITEDERRGVVIHRANYEGGGR